MNEFDKFSASYKDILDRDVKCFGEDSEYFASYKAMYVYRYLAGSFNGNILDYGCGIGVVSKFLYKFFKNKNVNIVGYDISAESIKEASSHVDGVEFTKNFEDIETRTFDAIVIANVLHHIKVENRHKYLKKAVANLRRGGKIFIFEHNPYNPLTQRVVRSSILDREAVLIKSKDMRVLLKKAGIIPIKKMYIIFFPKILKIFRPLEPLLGRFPLGAQYVFVGEV